MRRRGAGPRLRCIEEELVLGHGGVDFFGPGEDASGEIRDVSEACALEGQGGFLAAGSRAAVDDDLIVLMLGEFPDARFNRADGDERSAEVGDLVLVGFANVEDENVFFS